MTPASAAYPDDFEEQVRDLLANLYDYLKLVNNPVARRLGADSTGAERASAARGMVFQAIEAMKSDSGASPTQRQNRLYNILMLRYVEEQPTNETLNQLALSERQYYREHQRALKTISQIIWDKYLADADDSPSAPDSLTAELDLVQGAAGRAAIDPRAELEAALAATRVMAEGRGVALSADAADAPSSLNLAQPLFRQCLIWLISKLIPLTAAQGKIEIMWRGEDGPCLELSIAGVADAWLDDTAALADDTVFGELSRRLNAELEAGLAGAGAGWLRLRFDQGRRKILIVDDNPDTIALFRRYVANLPYQVLAAADESEALRIARGANPLCIILDILLPEKDGWQLLQACKSHPQSADVPVLICSALDMRALALSLGADGYMQKPPSREEFLALLRQWEA